MVGQKFLAASYYGQRAVFASLRALFSFLKQNTGNFKTETLLTGSHNFSAIGLKQFHKKIYLQ